MGCIVGCLVDLGLLDLLGAVGTVGAQAMGCLVDLGAFLTVGWVVLGTLDDLGALLTVGSLVDLQSLGTLREKFALTLLLRLFTAAEVPLTKKMRMPVMPMRMSLFLFRAK